MSQLVNISRDEFQIMRDYVERECGLLISDDKAYLFETRLTPLMAERGFRDFHALHREATTDRSHALRDAIIDAMTTNETLWFRDSYPFDILNDVVLADHRQGCEPLRIWSAACSTGQEPYSIAMVVRERPGVGPVEIVASDVSISALFLAKSARYDHLAMSRGLTSDRRERYFSPSGRVCVLHDSVRDTVQFLRQNLQDPFSSLGTFDVVFCRNVLMYFGFEFRKDVVERVHRSLKPGGVLFLGAAESLLQYSDRFELVRHGKGIYYKAR